MISGPPEEGPKRAGRTADEGLAKSSTCKVGMQVPCGYRPEISQEGSLRPDTPQSWRDNSGTVSAARHRAFGREGDARPCTYVAQCATEVQHSPYDRVSERQECDSHSPECVENERDLVWAELLVAELLCQHRGLGRRGYSQIHKGPRETPKRTRTVGIGLDLMAPFRGLPHTTGYAGGG